MVTLVIMDGFGYSEKTEGNAIALQGTPNLDKLNKYPHTLIGASGEAVGLTPGQMGNSEVGHLNLGAGRVLYQDMMKINKEIEKNTLKDNKAIVKAIEHAKNNNSALHFLGLCSTGGVHSHLSHLEALVDIAHNSGVKKIYIHFISDGRDTDPQSGAGFMKSLLEAINGKAEIADVCGRVYAMDREKRYDRVEKAYDLYVYGKGENKISDPEKALLWNYENGHTDEFVLPTVVNENGKICDGDSVIFFNYRTDRPREITDAITQDAFDGFKTKKYNDLCFVTMTEYADNFVNVDVAFPPEKVEDNLSRIISDHKMKQFHTSETTKYAHVTFFFNGGIEEPYPGEDRKLIDTIDVQNFAEFPEMRAKEITKAVCDAVKSKKYDFVLVNLSNPDMIGHTGDLEAVKKCIKIVDECAYEIAKTTLECGGDAIITADHGNAEEMILPNGKVSTAHSTNPVPLWLVSDKHKNAKLISNGKLANVAPTVLKLLGIKIPCNMEKPLF